MTVVGDAAYRLPRPKLSSLIALSATSRLAGPIARDQLGDVAAATQAQAS
eukprot:CAMPEP_0185552550 /NCGR_PEP_ID=MMETSP1381-20130426/34041_1 /TAXON_ID=298111 /ORGANISM="Pavlova sp., Strain CCMP459" /LENGTH=49 /DNA_ID= /DNA_START= /DNA_END= /DNA_ORIENTATION=